MSSAEGSPVDDLVVVVTGATGAAGPAVVENLARAGATVVAAGRDQARLDTLVADLPEPLHPRVSTSVVDLADEQTTRAWGDRLLADHGRIDGLVQLVGGWRGGAPIGEVDLADYEALHTDLVRGLQHATRALIEPITASPVGRVVIVSTTALATPTASNAIYLTAKAGAEAWMAALAQGWRDSNAAAVVLRVKALLTPQMVERKPDAAFRGYVPVAQVAEQISAVFTEPAAQVNGEVITLPGRRPS